MCSLQRKYFSSVTSTEGRVQILPTHRPAHRSEKRSAHWHQKSNCNLWTQSPHAKRRSIKANISAKGCRGPLILVVAYRSWRVTLHCGKIQSLWIIIQNCLLLLHEDHWSTDPSHGQLQRTLQGHWVGVRLWSFEYHILCKERSHESDSWTVKPRLGLFYVCMYVMHECVSPCPGPKMCWVPCCCVS